MSKSTFLLLLAASVVLPIVYFGVLDNDTSSKDEMQSLGQMPAKQAGNYSSVSYPSHPTTIDTMPSNMANNNPAMNPFQNGMIRPETLNLPANGLYYGDANGPDLTAPLEFMPVSDLNEIIRFDVSPMWVKNRWSRVSTSPIQNGIRGLRVPLVTGTNSWDLHGSLTYYFDSEQTAQRITFRGWTGDPTQLTNLLANDFDFKEQKTNWAGLYVAKKMWGQISGGMVMQHPNVIRSDDLTQQVAIVLEINNPDGQFDLSPEFRTYLHTAKTVN